MIFFLIKVNGGIDLINEVLLVYFENLLYLIKIDEKLFLVWF